MFEANLWHRCIGSACSPIPSLAPGPNCSAGSFAPPPSTMAPRCNFYGEDEDLRVARNVIQASIKTQHHAARAESFQLATRALPGSCSRWSRPMQSSLSLARAVFGSVVPLPRSKVVEAVEEPHHEHQKYPKIMLQILVTSATRLTNSVGP